MANYTFRFFFPSMDEARKYCEVRTYGGHIGTAMGRAWKAIRERREYKGIPGLRPQAIEIAPPEPKKKREIFADRWITTVKVGQ